MPDKLSKILNINDETKKQVELRKYAQQLGCNLSGTGTHTGGHDEEEVIRRIKTALKDREENNPLELKPNLCGFGIDLKKIWVWIKAKVRINTK